MTSLIFLKVSTDQGIYFAYLPIFIQINNQPPSFKNIELNN
jgi:hypothetical protein